jgi:hypothetical protein
MASGISKLTTRPTVPLIPGDCSGLVDDVLIHVEIVVLLVDIVEVVVVLIVVVVVQVVCNVRHHAETE